MARVDLPLQSATRAGLSVTFTNATVDGYAFPNDGTRAIRVKNTSGAPVTISVRVGRTVDGQTVAAKTFDVPATTGDVITGFWNPADYNQPDGKVWVDTPTFAGVSAAVIDF